MSLHEYVMTGDVARFLDLHAEGGDINTRDSHGNTPLMAAVYYYNLEMFDLLIEKGADPDLQNGGGATALTLACGMRDDGVMFEKLLKAGANPNVYPPGSDPFLIRCMNNSGETGNSADQIRKLIKAGANLNSRNSRGLTIIHVACQLGEYAIIQELVEAGADYLEKDSSGISAYDLEVSWYRTDILNYFKFHLLRGTIERRLNRDIVVVIGMYFLLKRDVKRELEDVEAGCMKILEDLPGFCIG